MVQAFRSLGVPARVRQHVHIKQRERGYDEATMVERFVVLADEFRDGNVPARMSPLTVAKRAFAVLHAAILRVPEAGWSLYGKADGREIRECAEVDFVPGEKGEQKDTQPLRYVALRIRPRQEELFADGSREKHFAVLSNIWEWTPERLIQWHRGA